MGSRFKTAFRGTVLLIIAALFLTACANNTGDSACSMSPLVWNYSCGQDGSIQGTFQGSAGFKDGETYNSDGLCADNFLPQFDSDGQSLTHWHFSAVFFADAPEASPAVKLHLCYDDGIRIYINQSEVFSDNISSEGSELAAAAVGSPNVEDIKVPITLLPGENLVEADLYQSSPSSSDAYFALEMEASDNLFGTLYYANPELLISKNGLTANFFTETTAKGPYYLVGENTQEILQFSRKACENLFFWTVSIPNTKETWYVSDGTCFGNPFNCGLNMAEQDFSFTFLGDPQITGNTSAKAFYDALTAEQTDFVLAAGDIVNSTKNIEQYKSAARAIEQAAVPFASAPGNHDEPELFDFFFMADERTESGDYSFSIGDTLFLVLDSNEESYAVHESFFRDTVGDEEWDWIIAVLHHSIYTPCGDAGYDSSERFHAFSRLFKEYGVSLALSGDDHLYGRTGMIDGTMYLGASSSTGSKLYDAPEKTPAYLVAPGAEHRVTSTVVTVSAEEIVISSKYADTGEAFDTVTISNRSGENLLISTVMDECRERLLAYLLPDGAISVYPAHDGVNWINPYFSDYAAMALIQFGEYYHVKDYISWHFRHLNAAANDYNGRAYTIYDYHAVLGPEGNVDEKATRTYDSVDSYSASFLILLDMYCNASGDKDFLLENRTFIAGVIGALLSLDTGNATVAKPDSDICYFMDNCEVLLSLQSAKNLIEDVIIPGGHDNDTWNKLLERIESLRSRLLDYIDSGFKISDDIYAWAVTRNGTLSIPDFSVFYPDSVAQLSPIIYKVIPADGADAAHIYDLFCSNWDWEHMETGASGSPWAMAAYCAAEIGDEARIDAYTDAFNTCMLSTYNVSVAEIAWLVLSLSLK